jgi:hypothetical protein
MSFGWYSKGFSGIFNTLEAIIVYYFGRKQGFANTDTPAQRYYCFLVPEREADRLETRLQGRQRWWPKIKASEI